MELGHNPTNTGAPHITTEKQTHISICDYCMWPIRKSVYVCSICIDDADTM